MNLFMARRQSPRSKYLKESDSCCVLLLANWVAERVSGSRLICRNRERSKGTMKKLIIQIILTLAAYCARGQGTLQFDQQVNPTTPPGGFGNIQPDPTGQSFVPTLSSIGFAQFYLADSSPNQLGSTLFVNVWSGSLGNGILLGQSTPVTVGSFLAGTTTFFFSNPVALTPGDTYYLQPVVQSGDSESIGIVGGQAYPNGMAYLSGAPQAGGDLWFREGTVVPEPSSLSLAVLGFIGIYPVLRKRRRLKL
jgi:hypothetical protein